MATIILVVLAASTTFTIFAMGYLTAEYKQYLKNKKLQNEEDTDKPE